MKKWVLLVLLISMFCIQTGCKNEEKEVKTSETSTDIATNQEGKSAHILGENISETINKDLDLLLWDSKLVSIIGFDKDSIESYLNQQIYGDWYIGGGNTTVNMNATSLCELEYGVNYIIEVCDKDNEDYITDIIKIYERGNENVPYYVAISSSYEFNPDGSVFYYSHMSLCAQNGTVIASYQDIPQQELEALWESNADIYKEESNENVSQYQQTPTSIPEPDKSDLYFFAMDYIDETLEHGAPTMKYTGTKYQIIDKRIKNWESSSIPNAGIYYYDVIFVVRYESDSQPYKVSISVSARYSDTYNEYYFDVSSKSVRRGK